MFGGDAPNLKPEKARELIDAARKAKAPGECPLGTLVIFTPAGDQLFQAALARARRDAVLETLQRNGVDATRFFVDLLVAGNKDDATLDLRLDRQKPKLTTTSVPPKGSKVKPGDQIKVAMIARDDAEPKAGRPGSRPSSSWPKAKAVASLPPRTTKHAPTRGSGAWRRPTRCPPTRRRSCGSRALAEDHAGLIDTDVGEFPTGDWYGTFGWTHICVGGGNRDETRGVSDLTLNYDGRGNLTGTLVGRTT